MVEVAVADAVAVQWRRSVAISAPVIRLRLHLREGSIYRQGQLGRQAGLDVKEEDQDLAEEQFPLLNEQFYTSQPAAYFRKRLQLLILAAGAADEITELLAQGVRYEKLIAQLDPTDGQREHQAFLSTEAEVLLHHASEALLRLYFAHTGLPPCPWLECARLRNFFIFKERVAKLRSTRLTPDERDDLARVFLGIVPDSSNAEATKAVNTIERLLRTIAGRLLDDGNFYNSAKHGLAIIAANVSLAVGDETGAPVVGSQGPSVAYLEVREKPDEPKRWHVTTRWVSARQAMWLTCLVISEMASLWSVAKCRYIDVEISGVEVITDEALDAVLTGEFALGQSITRFSQRLQYNVTE